MKNHVLAGIMGIALGCFGVHKFYLNKTFAGVMYVLFCWTYIPTILGFIEGAIYLSLTQENFEAKYCNN